MAQVPYRANLSAATFPLNISKFGRSVILPGLDQNFDRRVDARGDNSKDPGIPQVLYMENALPTAEGFTSIGFFPYADEIPDVSGGTLRSLVRIPIKSDTFPYSGFFFFIAFYSNDEARYLIADSQVPAYGNTWGTVTVPVGFQSPADDDNIFWATCQGRTFVLINPGFTCEIYEFNLNTGVTPEFINVTATVTASVGVSIGYFKSIAGTYNYLVLNTIDTVFWSSLVDPLDFTPSLVTGAGFESVGANLTSLSFLIHAAIGFYIFTRSNVVVAQYTGNKAYPWRFIPVENSGVVTALTDVVSSIEADDIFMRTVRGQLQQIEGRNAVQVIPEVTDYLERCTESDAFNWTTGVFTYGITASVAPGRKQKVRVWFVCERYLIISFNMRSPVGAGSGSVYQEAFVYDIMLKRLGKLKFDHTHILDDGVGMSYFNIGDEPPPYTSRRISQDIHEVLDVEAVTFIHDATIIFGNFKGRRNTILHLEEYTVEAAADIRIDVDKNFASKAFFTVDDVNYSLIVTPYLAAQTFSSKKYSLHAAGSSFRLGFKGQFRMSCIAMKFHEVGHEM